MEKLLVKANFIHTPDIKEFETHRDSYLYIIDGICESFIDSKEKEKINKLKKTAKVLDYTDLLIIPSFSDLHLHAPQYPQNGLGYDKTLLDWLDDYTFALEEKYKDLDFAQEIYKNFVNELYERGTLRSVIFSSIHVESSLKLAQLMAERGLKGFIGKVNMDREATPGLTETTEESYNETLRFIDNMKEYSASGLYPIITPRFAPSCTNRLMSKLGNLIQEERLPVQSHLSETKDEIAWVRELFGLDYPMVYDKYHMLGETPTLMAHGIYLTPEEQVMIKEKNVQIIHCPTSNMNIASGIMPLARYIDQNISVGLGSDIAGGHTLAMNEVMASAIQNAKLRKALFDERQVEDSEVFYCGTVENGHFFEKTLGIKAGKFEKGYSFDALVISMRNQKEYTIKEQLERILYNEKPWKIKARFLEGRNI